jgi:hypothetical protein
MVSRERTGKELTGMPSGRVVKRLLLALLLAAGANSLAGTEPAWRFQLETGKSVPSW